MTVQVDQDEVTRDHQNHPCGRGNIARNDARKTKDVQLAVELTKQLAEIDQCRTASERSKFQV